jgi:hypothetical protein
MIVFIMTNRLYTFIVNITKQDFSNPPNQTKNKPNPVPTKEQTQPITFTPTHEGHTIPTIASSWRYCPIANAKAATLDGVPYPEG